VKIDNFFAELKRRNVYKVAVAYAVVGWLLIQIATQVFPFFEIPNWAVRLIVLAIVVGFPIALVMAWAFELTPENSRSFGSRQERTDRRLWRIWVFVEPMRCPAIPRKPRLRIRIFSLSGKRRPRRRPNR